MKRKMIGALVALAVAVLAVVCASPAWAYFSDSHAADGGFTIPIKPDTDIDEPAVTAGQKVIAIQNKGEKLGGDSEVPVMVRAKVYYGADAKVTATLGDGWVAPSAATGKGDVYAYSKVLAVDEATTELKLQVELSQPKSDDNPTGGEEGDAFNVIVLYEATPFIDYDEAGNPTPAWTSVSE